jgi:hypothetical protein
MTEATVNGSRRTIGRVCRGAVAVLLFAAAMIHPEIGNAADKGGGFHHHFGRFHGGFGILGTYPPFWWGYGYPYSYYEYYANPDHGNYGYDPSSSYYGNHPGYDPGSSYYGNYPGYGYSSRPKARQTWYYCSDPAGYYPYVTQCKTGWAPVPAG